MGTRGAGWIAVLRSRGRRRNDATRGGGDLPRASIGGDSRVAFPLRDGVLNHRRLLSGLRFPFRGVGEPWTVDVRAVNQARFQVQLRLVFGPRRTA